MGDLVAVLVQRFPMQMA
jgi:hypothetical protein